MNVTAYILDNNAEELADSSIDNIFKYVMPINIYIPRNKNKRVTAIMCNYKFDVEHGLAVVFENEVFMVIDAQDIIL